MIDIYLNNWKTTKDIKWLIKAAECGDIRSQAKIWEVIPPGKEGFDVSSEWLNKALRQGYKMSYFEAIEFERYSKNWGLDDDGEI